MDKIIQEIDSKSISEFTICPTHKKPYEFIHLIPYNDQILKCAKCMIKQKIYHQNLLPIDEVKQCDDNTIFDNWPYFEDNKIVSEILSYFIDENQISQFFKDFRSEVLDQIDKIEENYIAQHQKLEQNKKILLKYFNKVSQKKLLKKSVINLEKDFSQSIQQIEKIIKSDIQQIINDDKFYIQSIDEQFVHYFDYLSIESMDIFKLEIKKSLDLMKQLVDYEIVDILKQEETSGALQVNENTDYLNNNQILYHSEQYLSSKQQQQNKNQIDNSHDDYGEYDDDDSDY